MTAAPRNRWTFVRLLGFLRPYKLALTVSVLLAFAAQAGTLSFVWLTGSVVKAIERNDRHAIVLLIGVVLAVGIAKAVATSAIFCCTSRRTGCETLL